MKTFVSLLACVACCARLSSASDEIRAEFEPTSAYEVRSIAGFNVLVSQAVLRHPEDAAAALDMLQNKLDEMCRLVPKEQISVMQKARVWIEWECSPDCAAQAHHSVGYLKSQHLNPEKAGCVEISNARLFVKIAPRLQPMMILHEFSHYYHLHYLSKELNKEIEAAYRKALDSGRYDSVAYVRGGKKRAYAMTNAAEYFAETTEAYFGSNDFQPFTYDELASFDPDGFKLMQKIWGEIDRKVSVQVVNLTKKDIEVFWINPEDSKLNNHRTMKSKECREQRTYTGHKFVAFVGKEKRGEYFVVPPGGGEWVIR